MRTYKQLTQEQRYFIYQLNKIDFTQTEIASEIGVHKSTVNRELKRNIGGKGYRPKQAHHKALERRQIATKATKMTQHTIDLIEEKLVLQWSPEQVSGWLLSEHKISLSHERIYQHIWQDKYQSGDLYQHLRRQGKKYQKRGSNGKQSRGQIIDRVSIEDRPIAVDDKIRVGDWEIDTVIGKGHSGALVTIVERKTLYTLIARVYDKCAAGVTQATIKLLMPFTHRTHTITADNGKELAYHKKRSLKRFKRLFILLTPIIPGSEV